MRWKVEFEYNIPEWGDVECTAETREEAMEVATKEFLVDFPEAVDLTIIGVTQLAV